MFSCPRPRHEAILHPTEHPVILFTLSTFISCLSFHKSLPPMSQKPWKHDDRLAQRVDGSLLGNLEIRGDLLIQSDGNCEERHHSFGNKRNNCV